MLNAGICGFIRFLEHNNAQEYYKIKGQSLFISKEFLKNNDIGMMYIDTLAEAFEKNTGYHRMITSGICNEIENLNTIELQSLTSQQQKDLNKLYGQFATEMLKASRINMYSTLNEYENITPLTRDIFDAIKKSDNLSEKTEMYKKAREIMSQKRVHNLLIYTELVYTKLKLFFSEHPKFHIISCLCGGNNSLDKIYNSNFCTPLLAEFEVDAKKKTTRCIEFMNYTTSSNKRKFSLLVDSVDDVEKKRSIYWFCSPDAYVCPLCAFIYTFIPLGFAFMGEDAVFINSNSNVEYLHRIMNTARKQTDDSDSVRKRLFRTFTEEKIDSLQKITDNVQVVMCSSKYSHFRFDVIDVEMVKRLNKGKNYFKWLEKKKINFGVDSKPDWRYVYDMVFDCITSHCSLYGIIDKIIKHEFDNTKGFNYVRYILYLQNIFYGGDNMDELNKKVDNAFVVGKALRCSILGENAVNSKAGEEDNKLRGFVYRLVNLASVGDCHQFVNTVIRIYSGFGLSIPAVFKDCYKSEDMFKSIAHGFILGLKYVNYKEDSENE